MAAVGSEEFPCGICGQPVLDEVPAVLCDTCDYWQHAACVDISTQAYEQLQRESSNVPWYCPACLHQSLDHSDVSSVLSSVAEHPPPPLALTRQGLVSPFFIPTVGAYCLSLRSCVFWHPSISPISLPLRNLGWRTASMTVRYPLSRTASSIKARWWCVLVRE